MRYELSHDLLAQQVYSKSSGDARLRRKMERQIREAAALGTKLSRENVDYYLPYLAVLNISDEERAFITGEDARLRSGARRTRAIVILTIAVLSLMLSWALTQQVKAKNNLALAEGRERELKEQGEDLQQALNDAEVAQQQARDSGRIAQAAALEAEMERDNATRLKSVAEKQADIASDKAQEALAAKLSAEAAQDSAELSRSRAQESARAAIEARDSLDVQKNRAETLRMQAEQERNLLLSQKIAESAYALPAERAEEKSLLAQIAYAMNVANPIGDGDHPAIYAALVNAYRARVGRQDTSLAKRSHIHTIVDQRTFGHSTGHEGLTFSSYNYPNVRQILVDSANNVVLYGDTKGLRVLPRDRLPGQPQANAFIQSVIERTPVIEGEVTAIVAGPDRGDRWILLGNGALYRLGMDFEQYIANYLATARHISGQPDLERLVQKADEYNARMGDSYYLQDLLKKQEVPIGQLLNGVDMEQELLANNIRFVAHSGERLWFCDANNGIREASSRETGFVQAPGVVSALAAGTWERRELLSIGYQDGRIEIYDTDRPRKPIFSKSVHSGLISCMAFSDENGKIAAGSYDKSVSVWKLGEILAAPTTTEPLVLPHDSWVTACSFVGSELLTGTRNGEALRWAGYSSDYASALCSLNDSLRLDDLDPYNRLLVEQSIDVQQFKLCQ